jgi:hypothetical protein
MIEHDIFVEILDEKKMKKYFTNAISTFIRENMGVEIKINKYVFF